MIQIHKHFKKPSFPIVDVLILNGRNNPEWLNRAIGSVALQNYPKKRTLILPNHQDGALSIGAGFNALVNASNAEYVLFLGDDDYLSHDYIYSLITGFQYLQANRLDPVHLSSFCTAIDQDGKRIGLHPLKVTGMFKRSWLLANPFDETLKNQIDTDIFKRMEQSGAFSYVFPHFYGYYYCQHDKQISKISKNEK